MCSKKAELNGNITMWTRHRVTLTGASHAASVALLFGGHALAADPVKICLFLSE